jgi:hypothetical protein
MSMEQWWNDTDRGKPKYWERNLFQWHFVHHKSNVDWPGIELGLSPATGQASQPWRGLTVMKYSSSYNRP